MKLPYRKSWAGNLLMWSDLTLNPSFKVKRGQPNLKGFITHLLLILEVCNVKPTCRILWAGNLLLSDLTFGPSLKVKRWFTGFGELSFWWIQICIGSPIRRSSFQFPVQLSKLGSTEVSILLHFISILKQNITSIEFSVEFSLIESYIEILLIHFEIVNWTCFSDKNVNLKI